MIVLFKGRSVCPVKLDSVFLRKQKFLNAWWRRVLGLASAGGGMHTFWEDRCESYPNGWGGTVEHWSLSSDNPVEGSHCFMCYEPAAGHMGSLSKSFTPISLPNEFNFRFWLRPRYISAGETLIIRVGLTTTSTGVYLSGLDASPGDIYSRIGVVNSGSVHFDFGFDEWVGVRCHVQQIGGMLRNSVYVNGVFKVVLEWSVVFGDLESAHMHYEFGGSTWFQDHFRVTD